MDKVFLISPIRSGTGKSPENRDATGTDLWKVLYVIVCLALLALAAYQFYNVFIRFPPFAPDFRGYVGAVQALNHMENPYIPDNINQYNGNVLPFVYPPHALYFFWLLQFVFVFWSVWMFYFFLAVLLIVSGYLLLTLDQRPHYLFLSTLLLTGFISLWWNFTRGNKDLLFLFLFSVIFTLLMKGKIWQSSIAMGLTAGFSFFAVPFSVLYLVVRRPLRVRLAYIALSLGVVASLFLLSYCINPQFLASYFDILRGSDSQLVQLDGWNCPTPYGLFYHLLGGFSPGTVLPAVLVSCAYVGIILYATRDYYKNHAADPLKLYSLVMLSVFMILPRMMPYNFIILVIPLYFLFRDCSYRVKILVLSIVSLLPLLIWYLPVIGFNKDVLPLLLGSYVQAYSLFLIFIVIVLLDRTGSVSHEDAKIPGKG